MRKTPPRAKYMHEKLMHRRTSAVYIWLVGQPEIRFELRTACCRFRPDSGQIDARMVVAILASDCHRRFSTIRGVPMQICRCPHSRRTRRLKSDTHGILNTLPDAIQPAGDIAVAHSLKTKGETLNNTYRNSATAIINPR